MTSFHWIFMSQMLVLSSDACNKIFNFGYALHTKLYNPTPTVNVPMFRANIQYCKTSVLGIQGARLPTHL